MDKQTINEVMKTIAEYAMIAEEAQKVVDANKELLKGYMTEAGLEELIGDEHKASYKTFEERRFDSTAFKKDHADMYEAYRKPQMKSRFTFA